MKNAGKGKGKGKRKKLSPEEQKKLELKEKIKEYILKIEEEESYCNVFDLEKQTFDEQWVFLKEELEGKKAELINQEREFAEVKEKNQSMIQFYREKVKQMLYQKQDDHAETVYDIENKLKGIENGNIKQENELITDNRGLKIVSKEQELGHKNYEFNLKIDSNKTSTMIRNEFEREKTNLKTKYDLLMMKLRHEKEEKSNKLISELELEKEEKVKEIINLHNKRYKDIKKYYSDITASNLLMIKQLKQELQTAQKTEERDKKMLLRVEDNFKKLSEPLKQKTEEIQKLKQDKEHWKKVKDEKAKLRNKIAQLEKEYRDIEYDYEIKFQQYQYLEDEFKRLKNNKDDKVYEIFQKSGLQNLILEKELKMVGDKNEVITNQINNVMIAIEGNEETKRLFLEKLRGTMEGKDRIIKTLKEELIEIREAHLQLIQTYQLKLQEHQIPINELGFEPHLPNLVNRDI